MKKQNRFYKDPKDLGEAEEVKTEEATTEVPSAGSGENTGE